MKRPTRPTVVTLVVASSTPRRMRRGRTSGTSSATGAEQGLTEAFKAVNRCDTLVCPQFDLQALNTFAKNWFADRRSDTTH